MGRGGASSFASLLASLPLFCLGRINYMYVPISGAIMLVRMLRVFVSNTNLPLLSKKLRRVARYKYGEAMASGQHALPNCKPDPSES